jgi:hypothetical protein
MLRREVRRRTPTSRSSSSESARVIDLKPEPSAALAIWWIALHATLVGACIEVGAPWSAKVAALAAVACHALARRPRRPERLVIGADGRVALPERGVAGLELGARSRYTSAWVRLELRGSGRALHWVLLADQVDPETWRTLQLELRRRGASAAEGVPDSPDQGQGNLR